MTEKKRLLWFSDTPEHVHVGQSKVARECVQRLQAYYDVAYAGFAGDSKYVVREETDGNIVYRGSETKHEGIPVYRILRLCNDVKESLARMTMWYDVIDRFKPDIIVLSHDVFEFPRLQDMKAKYPHIKIVGYFTVDGDPIDSRWTPAFDSVDHIWTCSTYGERAIKDRLFWLDVETIPYGINHDTYTSVDTDEISKHKSGLALNTRDKFVGLYIGHNQGRKNLAAALDGWRIFQKGKSDVMFIVITHHLAQQVGLWGTMQQEYDLHSFWCPTTHVFEGVYDDNTVSAYLKAADTLVFPTVGEGWGMCLSEAMASGCVPITTNFSGHTDFCTDENSYLMKNGAHVWSNTWMSRRFIVDPQEVANTIELAYGDWKSGALKEKKLAGIETVAQYNWDTTAAMMVESLENRVLKVTKRDRMTKAYMV